MIPARYKISPRSYSSKWSGRGGTVVTRLARHIIASIHNRKRPEGSNQNSSTGVPFAVVSRKNCSSRFSHLMRNTIHLNQSQSMVIKRAIKLHPSQSMVIKRARFGHKGEQRQGDQVEDHQACNLEPSQSNVIAAHDSARLHRRPKDLVQMLIHEGLGDEDLMMMRDAISMHSEDISGHQRQSAAISGHQRTSAAIR